MSSMMGVWRSLGQDASVLKQKVKPGTAKRMLRFAMPYAGWLALFLLVVVVDASIGIVNPLLYRQIINNGILKGNSALIIHLAAIVAVLGLFDGALGIVRRIFRRRSALGLCSRCGRNCSSISSRCRWHFSPAHRRALW